LSARATLHARFSTNPYGWLPWVYDQIVFPKQAKILDLGCGLGEIWLSNVAKIPDDTCLVLADISEGMLLGAQHNLVEKLENLVYVGVDAQAIPFFEETFDVVIANHMLYHISDQDCALCEIKRVLKQDGWFYAATNGLDHLLELKQLVDNFVPHLKYGSDQPGFNLENGTQQLES
jgi:ubiquinone/menaquinone biosynthesis C-methylase UbiE